MKQILTKGLGKLFTGLILIYKNAISPFLPQSCRYYPSCSEYGLEAIKLHGPFKGGWMALKRLGSCHPFGGSGFDPVPGSKLEKKAEQEGEK